MKLTLIGEMTGAIVGWTKAAGGNPANATDLETETGDVAAGWVTATLERATAVDDEMTET